MDISIQRQYLGADREIVKKVGRYVDRMSVNIELPTEEGLKLLAPQKE